MNKINEYTPDQEEVLDLMTEDHLTKTASMFDEQVDEMQVENLIAIRQEADFDAQMDAYESGRLQPEDVA